MSKYVPPHARNVSKEQQEERPRQRHRRNYFDENRQRRVEEEQVAEQQRLAEEKKRENTEENFPKLVSHHESRAWSTGSKTFAQLASEWDEQSKNDESVKKEEDPIEESLRTRYNNRLPRFRNVHRFVEPEEPESDESVEREVHDDGWKTVVHRKPRREKTIEEKFSRPLTPPQDSVWNAGEQANDHETCWDEKNY